MVTDPNKLLRMYERGALTPVGLQTYLIQAAAERDPTELAPALPADVLLELRRHVCQSDPEGGIFIWGGTLMPGVDAQKFMADQKRRWSDGHRRWQEYFETAG